MYTHREFLILSIYAFLFTCFENADYQKICVCIIQFPVACNDVFCAFLGQLYLIVYFLTIHYISKSYQLIAIGLRTLILNSLNNHVSVLQIFVCKLLLFRTNSKNYKTRMHLRNIAYCYCTLIAVCKYLLIMLINTLYNVHV